MKTLVLIIFLVVFSKGTFCQIGLTNTNWGIYKTLEIVNKDTTTFVDNVVINKNGNKLRQINILGGSIEFSNDSTGLFCSRKGQWYYWGTDSSSINIEIDNSNMNNKDPFFFGQMEIYEMSDSTIIFIKNIDRIGNWKRIFHLKKE